MLLLYANKTENDIVFREELAQIETGTKPQLQVIHLLTQPDAGWQGEKGRLDREKIQRLCGNRLTTSTFFLCCPPPMTRGLVQILAGSGCRIPVFPLNTFRYDWRLLRWNLRI